MAVAESIFINCPFDAEYQPLFRALVFAVHDCGFLPRSALERDDGSEVRIDKLRRIIGESPFGVHDISRTELDTASGLPRFNMPLELGIFLGAKYYGDGEQTRKACVIFDRESYRYQEFCSDLAGHDIRPHSGDEREVIRGVRDAARTWVLGRTLPGAAAIFERYSRFVESLPRLADRIALRPDELTFGDLSGLVTEWLGSNRPAIPPEPAAG
ncbi:hypothetical protein SAMN05216486_12510 [bacterium JGI 053]|nr:hypothetical protein SAMN05216486_12510 [bacterium JGI 053]